MQWNNFSLVYSRTSDSLQLPRQRARKQPRPKRIRAALIGASFMNRTFHVITQKNATALRPVDQTVFSVHATQVAFAKLRHRQLLMCGKPGNFGAAHINITDLIAARAAIRLALEAQAVFIKFLRHIQTLFENSLSLISNGSINERLKNPRQDKAILHHEQLHMFFKSTFLRAH